MTARELESPFHQGEQTVQLRMGVREIAEELGSKFILGPPDKAAHSES